MRHFKKNGLVILLEKDIGEPEEHFIERGLFVVSQKPKNIDEYNKVVRFSRIFRNVKYNNCEYCKKIMIELEEMMGMMYE